MLKASITLLSNYRPSSLLLSSCWCCSSEATTLTFLCFFLSNVLSTGFLRFRFQFISRRFHFFSKESSEDFRFFGKTLATIGAIKILLQNKIVFFQKLLHLLLFHAGISNTGDCETLTSALVCALECARVSERVCVCVCECAQECVCVSVCKRSACMSMQSGWREREREGDRRKMK